MEQPKVKSSTNVAKAKPDHLWKPGQSGNPAGRPSAGESITDTLRRVMHTPDANGRTPTDRMAEKAAAMVAKGDLRFMQFVTDRIEGKAPETITARVEYTQEERHEIVLIQLLESSHPEILRELEDKAVKLLSRPVDGIAPDIDAVDMPLGEHGEPRTNATGQGDSTVPPTGEDGRLEDSTLHTGIAPHATSHDKQLGPPSYDSEYDPYAGYGDKDT